MSLFVIIIVLALSALFAVSSMLPIIYSQQDLEAVGLVTD